jgi:hypothetical protein
MIYSSSKIQIETSGTQRINIIVQRKIAFELRLVFFITIGFRSTSRARFRFKRKISQYLVCDFYPSIEFIRNEFTFPLFKLKSTSLHLLHPNLK